MQQPDSNIEMSTSNTRVFKLLFVDDEKNILSSLRRLFRPAGYEIFLAPGGKEGLEILEAESIDLVISDMRMPEMDGAEFLEIVAKKYPSTIRLLLTGFSDITSTVKAINEGKISSYFCKPWDDDELLNGVHSALRNKILEEENAQLNQLIKKQNLELLEFNESLEKKVESKTEELQQTADMLDLAYNELRDSYKDTIRVFSNLIGERESDSSRFSGDVARLAELIATKMKLADEDIQDIYFAAQLCEIGKLCIPDALLNRSLQSFNPKELKQYISHPKIGSSVIMVVDKLQNVAEIIENHEEKFNGSGFPSKKKGLELPIGSRIISICKDYYNLQRGRLTEEALSKDESIQALEKNKNTRYDPDILPHFIQAAYEIIEQEAANLFYRYRVNELAEDMVIGKDLFSSNDTLLLAEGRVLTQKIITRLAQFEESEQATYNIFIKRNGNDE